VRIGMQVPYFTWPGGPATLGADLARIATTADAAGFDSLSVMDHLFQIGVVGPPELDMLEAYTTLGFLAAHTERVKLFTVMTAVSYRDPGLLAKAVTTLDVLSGGRAWLGIGAAWNEEESRGLGLFFPPTAERFERLEETLQICLQMWRGDESPYRGRHYTLERPLNVPQSVTRPHPPIMVGGGGERKTLRLVAKYADACNLFAGPELPRKLEILREHCEREGRDYAEIEKTAYYQFDVGADGERVDQTLQELQDLAKLGIQTALGHVHGSHTLRPLEIIGEQVIPAVADL
jgi:F420-dependent oxidoreductase-like protein